MPMLFYPAIFHKADEGGYWVEFPDLPECFTQGEDIEEAYSMATEALDLSLKDRIKENNVPAASEAKDIKGLKKGDSVVIVQFEKR